MLKRFQKIIGVGCFVSAHPPRVQFEPLSFIFGENCYGKSTLCDILRSLAENNSDYIEHRRSIPNPDNYRQHIQICFSLPGQVQEQTFVFHHNQWNPVLPRSLRILVFDTEFIHRNVFTGLTIERKNHESITQFVLGEGSAHTAEKIAHLNSELRALNKDIRGLEENAFEGLKDISTFIAMPVQETLEQINCEIQAITAQHQRQKELAQNLDKAANRQEPKALDLHGDLQGFADTVNDTLRTTFQEAHQDATARLQEHIQKNTTALPQTQTWIRNGLGLIKGDSCPFCGQVFGEYAAELLGMYRSFFDEAFNQFVSRMHSALDRYEQDLTQFSCATMLATVERNETIDASYPELAQKEEFPQLISALQAIAAELTPKLREWQKHYQEAAASLRQKISEKKGAIHTNVGSWDCGSALVVFAELRKVAVEYDVSIQRVLGIIHHFKGGLDTEKITECIQTLDSQLKELNLKRRRIDCAHACEHYKQMTVRKQEVEIETQHLQQQLEREQTEFLNNYFDSINSIFSRLGSNRFSISKRISRRGNLPTVQLAATFAGFEITKDRLQAFFSESDRRALALSIFWAKAESLSSAEKQQTILVLDDPVTSFDDGRIDRTIRLMERVRTEFRQIILLSHYRKYLKTFFDRACTHAGSIQLARITKNQDGSQLEQAEPDDFVEPDHQLMFRRIVNFIERRHTEDISRDLRVYLEIEVKSRFCLQIDQNALGPLQFRELLDALHNLGVLNQDLRDDLEQYRLSLNPDHHVWTGRTHEEKIGLAKDVIDFIYEKL